MKAKPRVRRHPFIAAPGSREDLAGSRYCTCGLPEGNGSHVPAADLGPDIPTRQAGERDDDE